jgi:hypothetical protein
MISLVIRSRASLPAVSSSFCLRAKLKCSVPLMKNMKTPAMITPRITMTIVTSTRLMPLRAEKRFSILTPPA